MNIYVYTYTHTHAYIVLEIIKAQIGNVVVQQP